MNRNIITFTANEQALVKTGGLDDYASNTVSYIVCEFELGDSWEDFDSVRAVFSSDFETVPAVLAHGSCLIPFEVLRYRSEVKVNLVGSVVEAGTLVDRLTSFPITALTVTENAIVDNTIAPISPSEFEEFVAMVRSDADRSEAGATSAEASAETATAAAQASEASALRSANSATDAANSATASANSATQAQGYAQNASESATSAENSANDAEAARDEIRAMRATATTLSPGSSATANYSNGLLSLGIPRGDKGETGDTGARGETGATPNLSIGTVTTLPPTGSSAVTITGTAENPVLNFELVKGDTGEVSQADLDEAVTDLKADLIGTRVISSYVQGARATDGTITANNNRVTTAGMIPLVKGDVIELTDNTEGQKYVLASTAGLDSGWKTASYTYTVSADASYFVNVAKSNGSTAITPSEVGLQMTVKHSLSIESNSKRIDSINEGRLNTKNLIGMKTGVLYPVNIPAKTPFTMSTSDGSEMNLQDGTATLRLKIYDSNKSPVDYFAFSNGLTERTVQSNHDASYLTWNYAYPIPLQVELGGKTSYVPYVPKIESLDNTPQEHEEDRSTQISRKGYFEINSSSQMAIGTHDSSHGYVIDTPERLHSADIFIPAYKGDRVIAVSDEHDIVVAITPDPFGKIGSWSSGWSRSIDFVNEYDGYYIFLAKATLGTFDASFKVIPAPFADSTTDIADYYQTEMDDTIAKVRTANDEPSLVFPLVTDIHRYTASVQSFGKMIDNLKYFNDRVKCDFLINLGDTIEGDQVQATSLGEAHNAITDFRSIGLPIFITEGNHDNNPYKTGEPAFDIKQCFSAWYSSTKDVTFNTAENGTDYYIDFHNLNVRLVCINSCNVNVNNRYAYGTTTANWLSGSALNTNYAVILIEHLSSIPAQVWSNGSPTNNTAVTNAIQAFVDGGGHIIQFSGHSHVDLAFIDPWLSIMQVCQKFEQAVITTEEYQAINGYIDVMGNPARTANTATEDAWSVCIYKPYSNVLHMIRFGAGIDRIFHATPIAPTTVTTQLDGEVTWSSSDTSVATVSSGVITGVASGKCAILAKDADGNYECWIVRVI